MAYDEKLAERLRTLLKGRRGIAEKKMFGGVGFLLNGNMCVGVWKEFLIVRLGVDEYDAALKEPGARVFDITGRAMAGWIMVKPEGIAGARLGKWVERAVDFVKTLPAKTGKK